MGPIMGLASVLLPRSMSDERWTLPRLLRVCDSSLTFLPGRKTSTGSLAGSAMTGKQESLRRLPNFLHPSFQPLKLSTESILVIFGADSCLRSGRALEDRHGFTLARPGARRRQRESFRCVPRAKRYHVRVLG